MTWRILSIDFWLRIVLALLFALLVFLACGGITLLMCPELDVHPYEVLKK